tara:strand:- start:9 stop:128 length:120 start_codon:yes stop_codon:yes gene_type:complete
MEVVTPNNKVVDMLAGQIGLVLLCKALIYTWAYFELFGD